MWLVSFGAILRAYSMLKSSALLFVCSLGVRSDAVVVLFSECSTMPLPAFSALRDPSVKMSSSFACLNWGGVGGVRIWGLLGDSAF